MPLHGCNCPCSHTSYIFAALKTKADMATTSPLLLPAWDRVTFENFQDVLTDKYLLLGFKNTGIILVVSLFFNVMFGTVTAFIIERFQFKGKGIVVGLFFMGMLIPTFCNGDCQISGDSGFASL